MKPPLKVDVFDSVFDPESSEKVIQKKQIDGKDLYRVFLYLKGLDLPLVRSVVEGAVIELTHQLTWDGEVDLGKVQLA